MQTLQTIDVRQPAATTATAAVGFGVVGCGWVARDYGIPALMSAGQVVHLCDRSADAAAGVGRAVEAASGRLPSMSGRVAELLADDAVEAVYVATPNHAHAEVVVACAEAGKAVLCEKPLAASVADAEAMVAACEAAGTVLATAYDQRWHPAHRAMQRMVAAGELGPITQARMHYACWLPDGWSPDGAAHDNWRVDAARAGGGAGIDLAPHGIDLLAMLLGRPWDDLVGRTQRAVQDYATGEGGVDDGAVLIGSLGGTLASLHVAYNCPDTLPRRRLELIGTRGRLDAVDTMGQVAGGSVTFTDAATGTSQPVAFDDEASPFDAQARWFAGLVRGERSAFPASRDLLHHRMLLEALRE